MSQQFQAFFRAVEEWRSLLQTFVDNRLRGLRAAQGKPKGAKFYPEIYLSDQGEAWIRESNFWSVLHRVSGKPLTSYRARLERRIALGYTREKLDLDGRVLSLIMTDGDMIHFSQRAGDYPEENWGWDTHKGLREPEWPFETYESFAKAHVSGRKRLDLAEAILRRRSEIENWLPEYSVNGIHGNSASNIDAFLLEFSPVPIRELSDISRLLEALTAVFAQLEKAP